MRNIWLVMLILISVISVSEEVFASPSTTGSLVTVWSKQLNEDRNITVVLPENYASNPEATYPVLYVLDGDYNVRATSGMLDFMMNKAQLIPDLIIVGISDKGTEQYRKYMTPRGLTAPFDKDAYGEADKFLAWMTAELKPYIQQHYRASDYSLLYGHSIGGLFVLNALVHHPESFNVFFASSPSVWLNDFAFVEQVGDTLTQEGRAEATLFLTLGDETKMGQQRFRSLLDEQQPSSINWFINDFPEENHGSAGLVALRYGLKTVFRDWFIPEKTLNQLANPDVTLNHYAALYKRWNMAQPVPAPSIRGMVRHFYVHKNAEALSGFIERAMKLLPQSAEAFLLMQANYVGHFDSPEAGLALLQQAADQFKHSIAFNIALSDALKKAGQKDKALAVMKEVESLASRYQANQWQMNIISAKIKEFEK